MKQRQAFKSSILAGWFITALVIILVALLIVPDESRSDYFWVRVVWIEVLALIFWTSASIYILLSAAQKDSVTRLGGIAPTISIVTAAYAILSFSVMVIHAFVPESDTASRVHWILQIILFAAASLLVVFLSISRAAATPGLGFDRTSAMRPKELHDLLVAHESTLGSPESQGLRSRIKQLSEVLGYSFSESASLAEVPSYQELSREINTLCDSLTGLTGDKDGQVDQINSLNESAIKLTTKAKLISAQQVMR